jgi:hypothetical protein
MPSLRTVIVSAVALLAGLGMAYVDSRPTWDDTGITAGAVLLVALVLGAAQPSAFWISGVAIGLPILAMNAVLHSNYGAALAVAVALVGAGAGAVLGKSLGFGTGTRVTAK